MMLDRIIDSPVFEILKARDEEVVTDFDCNQEIGKRLARIGN